MTERPILFNDEMVRALLDGRKTQTRRLVKPQPPRTHSFKGYVVESSRRKDEGKFSWGIKESEYHFRDTMYVGCPYGQPGDRLWVREAFAYLGNEDGVCIDWDGNLQKGDEREAARIYRASCERAEYGLWRIPDKAPWKPDTDDHHFDGAWRPSIHMPRWACRILLEVTAVRVERLHDISEEDAESEGVEQHGDRWVDYLHRTDVHFSNSARVSFATLWDSINGWGSWDANPWVWVVEFRRIEGGAA